MVKEYVEDESWKKDYFIVPMGWLDEHVKDEIVSESYQCSPEKLNLNERLKKYGIKEKT